ncbi:MAG: hypothetical protein K2M73_08415 [Lachnospiraceae bacterium]|nr:hypothetical protein [Lachnospiraceae bacterium]
MCTIGNSFYKINGIDVQSVFKQCDLVDATQFLTPVVETAVNENPTGNTPETIRYVAFTRIKGKEHPAWAGVNEYGVSFVAADSYLDKNKEEDCQAETSNRASVFDMYLSIITSYTTAKEAVLMAKKFYETEDYADVLTDILLISDEKEMYFIETVKKEVRIIKRINGHFASANHCRMFYEAVPYDQNHSTYLRLERAEKILQTRSDIDGIGDLLRDSYYGKTVWSVCRYAGLTELDNDNTSNTDEEMYYTQAAVIFTIKPDVVAGNKPQVICEYVINNNASVEKAGYSWKPFENEEPKEVTYIGKGENII